MRIICEAKEDSISAWFADSRCNPAAFSSVKDKNNGLHFIEYCVNEKVKTLESRFDSIHKLPCITCKFIAAGLVLSGAHW